MFDSEIVFEVCNGELVMKTTIKTEKGPISGTRTFSECDLDKLFDMRQMAIQRGSFQLNIFASSPRASFSASRRSSKDATVEISQTVANMPGGRLSVSKCSKNFLQRKPSIEISLHE